MHASAYLVALDLKRTHSFTTHTLLVKADTKWTMSSLGPSVSLSLLHALINTDWPVVEGCHLSIFSSAASFSPSSSLLPLHLLPSFIYHIPPLLSSVLPSVSPHLNSIHPSICPCIHHPLSLHRVLPPSLHPCDCFGPWHFYDSEGKER